MPSLRELQRDFCEGILNTASPDFVRHIRPGRFAPERHFQVYRNNVFESLTNALKAVYPVIERLVGEGFFRYACATYIPAHRPGSGNLHDFGGEFAGFLAGFPPARELAYLPDVARLEWAMHESFHAGDGAPMTPEALAALPSNQYENLKFSLHPSARLLSSTHPILRIWEVNQAGHEGDESVDLNEGGVKLLVIRRQGVVAETLSDGEHALLSAIAGGKTFADAAKSALSAQPDFNLTASLARHLQSGTLAGVTFEKE